MELDEQIVYDQLGDDEQAIWSLLLASGYLKVKDLKTYEARHTMFSLPASFQINHIQPGRQKLHLHHHPVCGRGIPPVYPLIHRHFPLYHKYQADPIHPRLAK